ncbi:hypothetical protein HBP72_02810 [Listeria welshimeri]|nr:hypothetical protein [Listeria welshimeri]MBC1669065.1 hypothetical protein [Listeria welshimeri]MBC1673443.1 hypothetical protein [Listeria welshimeri]MBC2274318.1 hypothetical protein [Listeria welshimeri]MBC2345264.1 hypothetical protein [Listeria welshimeri]
MKFTILTAGVEVKITMANGVSFKLVAGIIGAGFSAKTYDVIDERLRF